VTTNAVHEGFPDRFIVFYDQNLTGGHSLCCSEQETRQLPALFRAKRGDVRRVMTAMP
jgi:hypothetical protein